MKIFLDTADISEIRRAADAGLIDGVTTNPSLIAQVAGDRDPKEIYREICETVDGPISAEVVATERDTMVEEGKKLAALHDNIVVKLPLTEDGLRACRALTAEGIRTNVTLCFSASQALLAAKAGATYVSPFVGRLDDISHDGMDRVLLPICRSMSARSGTSTTTTAWRPRSWPPPSVTPSTSSNRPSWARTAAPCRPRCCTSF